MAVSLGKKKSKIFDVLVRRNGHNRRRLILRSAPKFSLRVPAVFIAFIFVLSVAFVWMQGLAPGVGVGGVSPSASPPSLPASTMNIMTMGGSPNDPAWSIDVIGDENFRILADSDVRFFIKYDGNVGIGTTSPGSALEVSGTVTATEFSGSGASLTNIPKSALANSGTLGFDWANDEVADALTISSSGSVDAVALTGTVASARLSGSYTGVTGVGTLGSLTIDSSTLDDEANNMIIRPKNDQLNFYNTAWAKLYTGAIEMNNSAITGIDWANSDDGAGSGLDADTLDGVQLASIDWANVAMATSDVSASDVGGIAYASTIGIGGLNDVTITSPSDDQVLTYSSGFWVNQDAGGGGITKFARTATLVVAANDSKDTVNADYTCDGTADQTEINAALTALPAGGGVVYLAEGTYTINASITISKNNVALVGSGSGTVITIPNGHNASINIISAAIKSNLLIKDLRIDGNKANQTTGNMCGIYFSNVNSGKILDCWVGNMRYYGIYLRTSSDNNTITGNTCSGNGYYGIYLYSSSNNTVTGNTCQGNTKYGIDLWSSCNNNTITGNTFSGNNYSGIYLYTSCNNNTITGNTCQGNGYDGITLKSSSNNNTITGNTCQGNDDGGIYLWQSSNNTLTGNTCQGNQYGIYLWTSNNNNTVTGNTCQGNNYHGIYLTSSSNNTVTGNTVEGNSQVVNTYDGIQVKTSDYNNIQGNTVRRGTEANQQKYGINIVSGTGNLVTNNDCYIGGTTAGIYDVGTSTCFGAGNRNNDGTWGTTPN